MTGEQLPPRYIGEQPVPQQPQPTIQQTQPPVLNALMQEERVSNFLSQTSPTTTLQNINYILKGFVYDNSAKEWIKVAEGIPEQIRLDFLQFITADLSEDVRMTNLDRNQINGIMELVIEWIVDYLDIVADDENLAEEQMTKISLIMMKCIYYTLLRSQNGMESKRIFGSLNLGEQFIQRPTSQQSDKNSWWQFWK